MGLLVASACGDDDPAEPDTGDRDAQVERDAQVDGGEPQECYHALDCDLMDCSEYEPVEPVCMPGSFGLEFWMYDGVCGSYRFRFAGNTHAGGTIYWDRESGKRVATYSFKDHPLECRILVSGDRAAIEQCKGNASPRPEGLCDPDTDAGAGEDGGTTDP
jgi:hypothetical protein